jgi:hypothetical protein
MKESNRQAIIKMLRSGRIEELEKTLHPIKLIHTIKVVNGRGEVVKIIKVKSGFREILNPDL